MRPAGKSGFPMNANLYYQPLFLSRRIKRCEIAGMQSCQGYLYVGLSVAAIRSRTHGNATHVKRERAGI